LFKEIKNNLQGERKMKKVLALVLAVLMITMAAGPGDATDGPKRAVYIARTLSDAFASWLANEMQRAAAQYSDTFTLEVLDSRGDSERQNSLIETAPKVTT
jgi:ABC-type sugar transport system substrate-binding protein